MKITLLLRIILFFLDIVTFLSVFTFLLVIRQERDISFLIEKGLTVLPLFLIWQSIFFGFGAYNLNNTSFKRVFNLFSELLNISTLNFVISLVYGYMVFDEDFTPKTILFLTVVISFFIIFFYSCFII